MRIRLPKPWCILEIELRKTNVAGSGYWVYDISFVFTRIRWENICTKYFAPFIFYTEWNLYIFAFFTDLFLEQNHEYIWWRETLFSHSTVVILWINTNKFLTPLAGLKLLGDKVLVMSVSTSPCLVQSIHVYQHSPLRIIVLPNSIFFSQQVCSQTGQL